MHHIFKAWGKSDPSAIFQRTGCAMVMVPMLMFTMLVVFMLRMFPRVRARPDAEVEDLRGRRSLCQDFCQPPPEGTATSRRAGWPGLRTETGRRSRAGGPKAKRNCWGGSTVQDRAPLPLLCVLPPALGPIAWPH